MEETRKYDEKMQLVYPIFNRLIFHMHIASQLEINLKISQDEEHQADLQKQAMARAIEEKARRIREEVTRKLQENENKKQSIIRSRRADL